MWGFYHMILSSRSSSSCSDTDQHEKKNFYDFFLIVCTKLLFSENDFIKKVMFVLLKEFSIQCDNQSYFPRL